MIKKSFFIVVLFLVNIISLTGCWNYRETNNLSIVAGMAIDKDEEGKYQITAEIVDMHGASKDTEIRSKRLETHGETLFDAIRNSVSTLSPRLYFGHTEIVILSQDIAREGILEIIDVLNRDAEPRLSIDLLVSNEKTAKEVLDAESITAEIHSHEINKMLDSQSLLSKAPKVQVYQFVNSLSEKGISPVLPVVRLVDNEGKRTSQLYGTAVFKHDRFIDFLDGEQTKYFLFATNKVKGGVLTLKEDTENVRSDISLEICESKTRIKPLYSNGKLSINIETRTHAALNEYGAHKNFIGESPILTLEKEAEEMLETNIRNVIDKVQSNFGVDIFGFGKIVREDIPDLWKQIESEWNQLFKDITVNIDVKVKIKNSGLLSEPIPIGE